MNKNLSRSQRICNAYTAGEVEKLKAYHSYTHGAARSAEEWGVIWSRRDDTAWAHVHGRMRGFAHIWWGSVTAYDVFTAKLYGKAYKRYPELLAGKDTRPLMGSAFHPLCSGIIEVADDGETARCSYITPGLCYSILNDEGRKWGQMLWERYGSDFRYEEGRLLYIHEHVMPDFYDDDWDCSNFARNQYRVLAGIDTSAHPEGPPPVSNDPFEDLVAIWTDPGPLNERSGLLAPIQDVVPWPEPYETLNNRNTYAQWDGYPD